MLGCYLIIKWVLFFSFEAAYVHLRIVASLGHVCRHVCLLFCPFSLVTEQSDGPPVTHPPWKSQWIIDENCALILQAVLERVKRIWDSACASSYMTGPLEIHPEKVCVETQGECREKRGTSATHNYSHWLEWEIFCTANWCLYQVTCSLHP